MGAEHHGAEVLAHVVGLHAHVLGPGADAGEADPLEPRRGVRGRLEVPRPGPALERGLGDGVDRGLHGRDVARPAALGDDPAARAERRGQALEEPVVVGDPVEGGGREDRVDGLVQLQLEQVGDEHLDARAEPLPRLLDHRGRAVDGDDVAARQPLHSAAVTRPVPQPASSTRSSPSQLEAVEHLAPHRLQRRGDALVGGGVPIPRPFAHSPSTSLSASSAASPISAATSSFGWRQPLSTWPATMSGSVVSGRPTPTRTRQNSAPPSSRFKDFSPLWPASPPPSLTRMSPNGQVDLVVDDEDAVEIELVGPARRADRAPRVVHERLRLEHRHPRAARAGAALGQLTRELLLRLRQVPALDQRVGDAEARRCAGSSHRTARGCRARRSASRPGWTRRASAVVVRSRLGLVARGALGLGLGLGLAASSSSPSSGSPSSPTSSVSVSISSSTGSSVGGVIVAMTVSSRSSSSVTPSRDGDGGQRERLVHLQAGDVVDDRVRDVVRQRLDVELARLLAEHAALGDAGRLVAAAADRARRPRGSAGSCRRAGGRGGSPRRAPDGSGHP